MNVLGRLFATVAIVAAVPSAASGSNPIMHEVFGTIVQIDGAHLTVLLRSGHSLAVDDSAAVKTERFSAPLFIGKTVRLEGSYDSRGAFHAVTVTAIPKLTGASADH